MFELLVVVRCCGRYGYVRDSARSLAGSWSPEGELLTCLHESINYLAG